MQGTNQFTPVSPFFWLGFACCCYLAWRYMRCFRSLLLPYTRSYIVVLLPIAAEMLGWTDMRTSALCLLSLVVFDLIFPLIFFPPLRPAQARAFLSPLTIKNETRLCFVKFGDSEYDLELLRPADWEEDHQQTSQEGVLRAVVFRGRQLPQLISLMVNDAGTIASATPKQLEHHAKRQVLFQKGKMRSYGFLRLGQNIPVFWCEYAMGMGMRIERRPVVSR